MTRVSLKDVHTYSMGDIHERPRIEGRGGLSRRLGNTTLEQLVLQRHVRLRLQPNTSAEDVRQGTSLLGKSIDNRCARRGQRCLQHVAEDAENAVKSLVVLVGGFAGAGLPLNASHHLGKHNEIDNQWRCQQGVLAHVEETDGLVAAHEDLSVILVQSAFVVADRWHVLDDDGVIWVFSLFVKDVVGSDHIIHHIRLGDLLRAKLLLRAQILAVIVAEMVVARNGGQLDASIDQKVHQCRLHLRLARFEVISTDEGSVLLS